MRACRENKTCRIYLTLTRTESLGGMNATKLLLCLPFILGGSCTLEESYAIPATPNLHRVGSGAGYRSYGPAPTNEPNTPTAVALYRVHMINLPLRITQQWTSCGAAAMLCADRFTHCPRDANSTSSSWQAAIDECDDEGATLMGARN